MLHTAAHPTGQNEKLHHKDRLVFFLEAGGG